MERLLAGRYLRVGCVVWQLDVPVTGDGHSASRVRPSSARSPNKTCSRFARDMLRSVWLWATRNSATHNLQLVLSATHTCLAFWELHEQMNADCKRNLPAAVQSREELLLFPRLGKFASHDASAKLRAERRVYLPQPLLGHPFSLQFLTKTKQAQTR